MAPGHAPHEIYFVFVSICLFDEWHKIPQDEILLALWSVFVFDFLYRKNYRSHRDFQANIWNISSAIKYCCYAHRIELNNNF